jgi:hypothetical protein
MAMNDEDVLAAVRDGWAPVQMSTTTEVIVARGRSLRRRKYRGRLAAGGALALALAAGLSVPVITHGAPQQATLEAWTVNQHPDGSIAVTIRELRDLPALQARLAADGARVTVSDATITLPQGCVAPQPPAQMSPGIVTFNSSSGGYFFLIQPSQIPSDRVLLIVLSPGSAEMVTSQNGMLTIHGAPDVKDVADGSEFLTLIRDSAQCIS